MTKVWFLLAGWRVGSVISERRNIAGLAYGAGSRSWLDLEKSFDGIRTQSGA